MIRLATDADWPAIWAILEPVFRAGETYAVDRDISDKDARRLWMDAPAATYVALDPITLRQTSGEVIATYYIKTNHHGAASHVCNCGYVTAADAQGRGIARAMCTHSLGQARAMGYRAMQFNLVLASNTGAVALWHKIGFETVGMLPDAFDHPTLGLTDAHVMWKTL